VGAFIRPESWHLGHFDDDFHPELFFTSAASDNGAAAGGLDDRHAYIEAFELSAPPRLQWHREVGGIRAGARLRQLPCVGGMDVLRQTRAEHLDLPVVIISEKGTTQTAGQATKAGAYDFLEKPVDGWLA
jgi:DNA-binding NarL/FixJ family response regulator